MKNWICAFCNETLAIGDQPWPDVKRCPNCGGGPPIFSKKDHSLEAPQDLRGWTKAIEYIRKTEKPTDDEMEELTRLIAEVSKKKGRDPVKLAQLVAHEIDNTTFDFWIDNLTNQLKDQTEKEPRKMKQITAYEVEGKLFKTEQEARQNILEKKLNEHFRSKDAYDMLRRIIRNKETRDFLIEAFKECDQPEAESSEKVNDDLLARELELESAKQQIQLDQKRIEAIKGPLRAFLGVGEYNNPGNQAYGDGFVLKDIQSKYSTTEIEEARRQIMEEVE